MPAFKPRFESPLEELIETAGHLDADEQLDLQSPQEHVAAQEPEYIHALGVLALQRAQEWLQVAYVCRDELVEQDFVKKSRKRPVVLSEVVPELGEVGDV